MSDILMIIVVIFVIGAMACGLLALVGPGFQEAIEVRELEARATEAEASADRAAAEARALEAQRSIEQARAEQTRAEGDRAEAQASAYVERRLGDVAAKAIERQGRLLTFYVLGSSTRMLWAGIVIGIVVVLVGQAFLPRVRRYVKIKSIDKEYNE